MVATVLSVMLNSIFGVFLELADSSVSTSFFCNENPMLNRIFWSWQTPHFLNSKILSSVQPWATKNAGTFSIVQRSATRFFCIFCSCVLVDIIHVFLLGMKIFLQKKITKIFTPCIHFRHPRAYFFGNSIWWSLRFPSLIR